MNRKLENEFWKGSRELSGRIFCAEVQLAQFGKKEEISVTVCVAAMCGSDTIIGASDRMLTTGDIQFEPHQSKIIPVTRSIICMVAGDSAMQAEILQYVQDIVNKRIEAEPQNWWNVRDVAELYDQYYNEARLKRAEKKILAPLGLDRNTFIDRQKQMDSELVRQLSAEMKYFTPPPISAIFAGIDTSGPHIYVADNENVTCRDLAGFAAIGAGMWHANSQLMFAGHTKSKLLPETLLLIYYAKRRAEVAPGVGEGTDMFMVGPALGSYISVGDHVLAKLKEIYEAQQKREKNASIKANKSMYQYTEELRTTAPQEQATASPDS
ncbi:MAG: hypothetical protein L6277_07765, partial [Desulfobacterales bacterium]|nr:hypothetical protein [Desulfobacterales bacterium]